MLLSHAFALVLIDSFSAAAGPSETDDFADMLSAEIDAAAPEPAEEPEAAPAEEPEPAPEPEAATMSDAERMERAKALYGEGDSAFQAGEFPLALSKFEEAYNVYAPDLHVFNINIGLAAFELGDCVKAKAALQRFLDLVKEHPSRETAQANLQEIERTGCAEEKPPEPVPTPAATTSEQEADDDDRPLLTARKTEREQQADKERKETQSKKKPLLIAGAVLTSIGVAALAGGAASTVIANQSADELQTLSSPSPETGFPAGDYSDPDVFALDRNELPAANYASIGLFAGGGALLATGVTLIVVHVVKRKKAMFSDPNARRTPARQFVGASPVRLDRGLAGAATFRF